MELSIGKSRELERFKEDCKRTIKLPCLQRTEADRRKWLAVLDDGPHGGDGVVVEVL